MTIPHGDRFVYFLSSPHTFKCISLFDHYQSLRSVFHLPGIGLSILRTLSHLVHLLFHPERKLKRRLGEVKRLSDNCTASKWPSWKVDPGVCPHSSSTY